MFFVGLIIGLIIGAVLGTITMELFCASKVAKDHYENMFFMDEETYHELRRIKREAESGNITKKQ